MGSERTHCAVAYQWYKNLSKTPQGRQVFTLSKQAKVVAKDRPARTKPKDKAKIPRTKSKEVYESAARPRPAAAAAAAVAVAAAAPSAAAAAVMAAVAAAAAAHLQVQVVEVSAEEQTTIVDMIAITDCSQAEAVALLRRVDWDVEQAVCQFFDRPRRQGAGAGVGRFDPLPNLPAAHWVDGPSRRQSTCWPAQGALLVGYSRVTLSLR